MTDFLHFAGAGQWTSPSMRSRLYQKTHRAAAMAFLPAALLAFWPQVAVESPRKVGSAETVSNPKSASFIGLKIFSITALSTLLAEMLILEHFRKNRIAASRMLGTGLAAWTMAHKGKFPSTLKWQKRFEELEQEISHARRKKVLLEKTVQPARMQYLNMLRAKAVILPTSELLESYLLGRKYQDFALPGYHKIRAKLDFPSAKRETARDIAEKIADSNDLTGLKRWRRVHRETVVAEARARRLVEGCDRDKVQQEFERILAGMDSGRSEWSNHVMDSAAIRILPFDDGPEIR